MIIDYLFSSPDGDIYLSSTDLKQPFLISPYQKHPFLTLGDYFNAIEKYILDEKEIFLMDIFSEPSGRNISSDKIEMVIRSEKHGMLYHISSVEITAMDETRKLCIISALSQKAKEYMTTEFELLQDLRKKYDYPYTPKALSLKDIRCNTGDGAASFLMFCTEWFEGYHEWHLASRKDQIVPFIWNMEQGHRFASLEDSFEIFRQIAFILTLYYDPDHFRQILNWHHSAGDFIVKIQDAKIELRLITVRQYNPLTFLVQDEQINPLIAIIYFLFDTTLRARIDKVDGTGGFIFAGQYSLDAAVKGFFEALKQKENEGRSIFGGIDSDVQAHGAWQGRKFLQVSEHCKYFQTQPNSLVCVP